MSKELKAADKLFKEGKEAITKSFFNWTKDFPLAASNFDKALKIYQLVKEPEKVLLTIEQLLICNEQMNDRWAVARNLEASIETHLKYFPETPSAKLKELTTKAFIEFRVAESSDKGLSVVKDVSIHLIKRGEVENGLKMLEDAYESCLDDTKCFKKRDLFGEILEAFVNENMFEKAVGFCKNEILRQNGENCDQLGLIVIILILLQGDSKRAESEMIGLGDIIPRFLESDECEGAQNLLRAYNKGEAKKFKQLTAKAVVTCIYPVNIIRKLREVKVVTAQELTQVQTKASAIKQLLF